MKTENAKKNKERGIGKKILQKKKNKKGLKRTFFSLLYSSLYVICGYLEKKIQKAKGK